MDKLVISDLQFHAYCGVMDAERETGQRVSVDLEMFCDLKKSASEDRLEGVPDYSQVSALVLEVGRKQRFKLLESLADQIACAVLREFPVREVILRVRKFKPPVEAIQGYFGVEVRRCTEDLS